MRRSDTHTAGVGAVYGGRVRIGLRPELYAYGAVCVLTVPVVPKDADCSQD